MHINNYLSIIFIKTQNYTQLTNIMWIILFINILYFYSQVLLIIQVHFNK